MLLPSFLGGTLLLFANAFSAYATAKALISQGSPIVPLQIGAALTSEVVLGQDNIGKAMALGMVVIVAVVHAAVRPAAEADRAMAAMTPEAASPGAATRAAGDAVRRRRSAAGRAAVGGRAVVGMFFCCRWSPWSSSRRARRRQRPTLDVWRTLADVRGLADVPRPGGRHRSRSAGWSSSPWCLMLVLLVPTMIWVRLRLPWLRRPVEFLCLLPLTIPAIVLVVGLAPVYRWVAYFLGDSSLTLCLRRTPSSCCRTPTARSTRGCSAIDVRTLAEAARSLGAGWGTVIVPGRACRTSAAPSWRRRSSRWRWCSASSRSPSCSAARTCRWRSTCSASATPASSVAVVAGRAAARVRAAARAVVRRRRRPRRGGAPTPGRDPRP